MSDKAKPIQQRILDAAKEEFLAHGYMNASMRTIAGKVGVSATALYRHFADKQDLFAALVEPVWQVFEENLAAHDENTYRLAVCEDPSKIWERSEQEFLYFFNSIYEYYDAFKLILCGSSGTKYSQFQHDLVEREVKTMGSLIDLLREQGHRVNPIDPQTLHLLMSGFFSSLFEMVIHDYSRSDTERHIKVLSVYFSNGMQAVLGM